MTLCLGIYNLNIKLSQFIKTLITRFYNTQFILVTSSDTSLIRRRSCVRKSNYLTFVFSRGKKLVTSYARHLSDVTSIQSCLIMIYVKEFLSKVKEEINTNIVNFYK